jgi:hypothetical protein
MRESIAKNYTTLNKVSAQNICVGYHRRDDYVAFLPQARDAELTSGTGENQNEDSYLDWGCAAARRIRRHG